MQQEPLKRGPAGGRGKVRLTPEELDALLEEAIARQGDAERRRERAVPLLTLDDALEVARTLNVPEQHVRDAAEALQRRKLLERARRQVRRGRRAAFLFVAGATAWPTYLAAAAMSRGEPVEQWLIALTFTLMVVAGALFWRWRFAPIQEAEAARAEVVPVAGTCRVCGAPAHNERATFCEEHRYRGPGE